ncbi:MAG: hypothetical protein LBP61_08270 [Desulfovibrio sp.]|jgi:hypothetical protein|nr:hypothetical protein [Desulfovibrio sp.]
MIFSPWTDFLDQVSPSAVGAPVGAQLQAIKAATIRLCQTARVWSHVSLPADLLAGERKYAFRFEDMEAQVVGVNSFRVNGRELRPAGREEWPYGDEQRGQPLFWREEEPGFVVLWPIPDRDEPGSIVAHVDLAPALGSGEAPRFLLVHYREAIKWGALAELVNTGGQAWGNPNLAIADYEKRFRREIARARILENIGGAAGKNLRVDPLPYF